MLTSLDQNLRGLLTRQIARLGHAPSLEDLAIYAELSEAECRASLRRLHDAHALLLHPHACQPWVVHPFALTAGSCWVQTPRIGYWANCLYCAFGIAAAMRCDAKIYTRYGCESQETSYFIRDGTPQRTDDIFHLSTPAARWWDNVVAACASFQPFKSRTDAENWCKRHNMPAGHSMTIPELWSFASDWYGDYLVEPWRKRSSEEVLLLFGRHGLGGDFWQPG